MDSQTNLIPLADILEARSVGNFSGRELPAWEASLALRLKEQGHPELFELHVRTTDGSHFISNGSNGFLDVVDVPTSLEPAETSLQDVVESAVAAIDQSLSTTTAATEAVVAANSSLPDSRLACSPDRHDVGAEPSPANLNQVDTFLLDIFLQIHQQMLHKLHPGRLAETRELFLQDFVRRRSGWEKSDIETSSTMRKSMRDGIKTALGVRCFSSSLPSLPPPLTQLSTFPLCRRCSPRAFSPDSDSKPSFTLWQPWPSPS